MNTLIWLAVIGSAIAIAALAVDAADRFFPSARTLLRAAGRRVSVRRSKSAVENLRQVFNVAGAAVLLCYAALAENALYMGLEVLLVLSGLLWYVSLAKNEARSEAVKGYLRFALAILVGVLLWALGYVSGFHWAGIVGLEVLGCGFVLARPLILRDGVMLAGGLSLTLYAVLGMLLDAPEARPVHIVWFILNAVYSLFALVVFLHTVFAGRDTDQEQSVAVLPTDPPLDASSGPNSDANSGANCGA